MLNKELSHLSESSKSGNQISEYICSTFLGMIMVSFWSFLSANSGNLPIVRFLFSFLSFFLSNLFNQLTPPLQTSNKKSTSTTIHLHRQHRAIHLGHVHREQCHKYRASSDPSCIPIRSRATSFLSMASRRHTSQHSVPCSMILTCGALIYSR